MLLGAQRRVTCSLCPVHFAGASRIPQSGSARGRRALSLRVRACERSEAEEEAADRAKPLLIGYAGGIGGTLVAAAVSAAFNGDFSSADDALFGTGTGLTPGDVTGAGLWATALYFANPWQLLLLFLGARTFEVDRPGDDLLRLLGRAVGNDVDAPEYEAAQPLRLATVAVFALIGAGVSAALSASLGGEATWSVSTGFGAVLVAGVVEVGRPKRLTAQEQVALEQDWQEFKAFADACLVRKGRCHVSEIDKAFRRYSIEYRRKAAKADDTARPGGAAADTLLRDLVSNWAPQAQRTSGGFYKGLSVAIAVSPSAQALASPREDSTQ